MNTQDIDNYFGTLGRELKVKSSIILIGGAASLIMGGLRPTRDVDFEIQTAAGSETIEKAVKASEHQSGLASHYSSDIERWSMLNLPDYRKHTKLYKRFGKLTVTILKPEYWSIGKVGRYLDSDIQDMLAVFKEQKTKPKNLIKARKKVLKTSPLSDELFHFKKHAEHFLKTFGKKLWSAATIEWG